MCVFLTVWYYITIRSGIQQETYILHFIYIFRFVSALPSLCGKIRTENHEILSVWVWKAAFCKNNRTSLHFSIPQFDLLRFPCGCRTDPVRIRKSRSSRMSRQFRHSKAESVPSASRLRLFCVIHILSAAYSRFFHRIAEAFKPLFPHRAYPFR